MDAARNLDRGRRHWFGVGTCSVKRSAGSAAGYKTPATVHGKLACSRVYELSQEEKERAGLATVTWPCLLFVEVPESGVIQEQDVVVVKGLEYLVVKATRRPHDGPFYYELILDYSR